MCSVSKNQTVFNNTSGRESPKVPKAYIESISLISKASAALLFFPFSFLLSVFLIFPLENANWCLVRYVRLQNVVVSNVVSVLSLFLTLQKKCSNIRSNSVGGI